MAGPLIPNVMGLLIPMILGDLSQHRLFVSSLVSSLVSGSLARISSVKSARSSIQTKVDRDPRSNLAYQRCVPLTDPCSLACRSSFPDPVPRSERSGSPATMIPPAVALRSVVLLLSSRINLKMPTTMIALYITVCSVLFIISKMLISFLCYKKWARKKRIIETSLTGGKMVIFRSAAMQSLSPKSFMRMIMGLSSKDVIGSGGYGTVYMLRLDEKSAFAIKKLNRGSAEMDRGFERELDTMGDIKHRNIVPLVGYYAAPHFNLLIYELMPNGSLDGILHCKEEEKKRALLDWPVRYKIALGVARGLSYLHDDCIPHVIHRDIKSSNILLDHNMEARVSDFGLATLMKPNESHVTTVVAGTFGYLAPEYFETGRATTKGDVYSYGVVLLELLTGKRPTDESFLENGTRLVTWVKETMEEKREEHAVDSALASFPAEEVKFVFTVAEKCLESDPRDRPTMTQVAKMLEQAKLA